MFRPFILAILIGLAFISPASAWQIKTRFGDLTQDLSRLDTNDQITLLLNGKAIGVFVASNVQVEKVIEWEHRDVVLVRLWSGGASCCSSYHLISITSQKTSLSNEFGNFMYLAADADFDIAPESIRFNLFPDKKKSIAGSLFDHLAVRYDGTGLTINMVLLGNSE